MSLKRLRNVILILPLLVLSAPAADWLPLDPLNLELATPRIDPKADAEAIFWEVWVEDKLQNRSMPQTITETYLRVKIFTEKGAEDHSTVELASANKSAIRDLRARTIKPDGRIIPVEKAAIFEQMKVRTSGLKVRTTSCSLPDVQPGDIIEYQWKHIQDNKFSNYQRLYLQREIPVWRVKYRVKPADLQHLGYRMRTQAFNIDGQSFQREGLGFYGVEYTDMPAFHREPYMPPEDEVQSWILLFYGKLYKDSPQKYWEGLGKDAYKIYKQEMKVDGEVKAAAASIVGDAQDPAEKVRLIREFCLNEITSVYHDRFGISAEERRDRKPNKKPSDTLKTRQGDSGDLMYLYGALLTAAGLDARIARVAGRDDSFFNPGLMDPYFLNRYNVAVKIDGEWMFSDPGAPYLPHGMLSWAEEGVQALITDPKKPVFVQTQFSGPEKTVITRHADLRLLEDGTLEGEVRVEANGHTGNSWKTQDDGKDEEERLDDLTEDIRDRLGAGEVSDLKIENVTDLTKPYSYTYKVSVPGYAMRTGKRLFLQPAFFQFGKSARFQSSERNYDIYFRHTWTELDQVTIAMPEGYELENPEAPQPLMFEPAGHYKVGLSITPDQKLFYEREFVFGKAGGVLYEASAYPIMKQVFDQCHEQDNRAVTLKQTAVGPSD
jgi:uncharacterized protein DUF3857/transglutaminase superfamily protein